MHIYELCIPVHPCLTLNVQVCVHCTSTAVEQWFPPSYETAVWTATHRAVIQINTRILPYYLNGNVMLALKEIIEGQEVRGLQREPETAFNQIKGKHQWVCL